MKLKLGATILAVTAALTVGVGSASAGAPVFGCFSQGGSFLFPVGAPGDEDFVQNARDCAALNKDGVNAHIAPVS
jgi:hypothetical protein